MPAVPGPQVPIGIPGSNPIGMGVNPIIGGYPTNAPNYYNQGANFVGYRAPAPGGFINTNGYVNANYQQAQQAKFM